MLRSPGFSSAYALIASVGSYKAWLKGNKFLGTYNRPDCKIYFTSEILDSRLFCYWTGLTLNSKERLFYSVVFHLSDFSFFQNFISPKKQ